MGCTTTKQKKDKQREIRSVQEKKIQKKRLSIIAEEESIMESQYSKSVKRHITITFQRVEPPPIVQTYANLKSEQAVKQCKEYLKCLECKLIVESPEECQSCSALVCETCLKSMGDDKCEGCGNKFIPRSVMNHYIRNVLNSTQFSCETCAE